MIGIWGANGFIGRNLAYALASAGESPALFARDFNGFPFSLPAGVLQINNDFADPAAVPDVARQCHTLVLLVSGARARDPEACLLPVYEHFFKNLAQNPGAVKHIIYLSSGGAVYGVTDREAVNENSATSPISPYGQDKLAIESLIKDVAQNTLFKYSILRPANPLGLWSKKPSIINHLLNSARTGTPVTVFGDGTLVRDYFNVSDLAEAIRLCIKNGGENEIYNVGTGTGTALNEVIQTVTTITGRKIIVDRQPSHPFEVPFNVLDCGKIKKALGWEAKMQLDDIIKFMWDKQ